jgi:hypothetical protein
MSQPAADDAWVLAEAEELLDTDGLREHLELVAAGLRSGAIVPVPHEVVRREFEQLTGDQPTL